jgi:hypothetical protein
MVDARHRLILRAWSGHGRRSPVPGADCAGSGRPHAAPLREAATAATEERRAPGEARAARTARRRAGPVDEEGPFAGDSMTPRVVESQRTPCASGFSENRVAPTTAAAGAPLPNESPWLGTFRGRAPKLTNEPSDGRKSRLERNRVRKADDPWLTIPRVAPLSFARALSLQRHQARRRRLPRRDDLRTRLKPEPLNARRGDLGG